MQQGRCSEAHWTAAATAKCEPATAAAAAAAAVLLLPLRCCPAGTTVLLALLCVCVTPPALPPSASSCCYYKPAGAHHCTSCGACVMGLDHHVWPLCVGTVEEGNAHGCCAGRA